MPHVRASNRGVAGRTGVTKESKVAGGYLGWHRDFSAHNDVHSSRSVDLRRIRSPIVPQYSYSVYGVCHGTLDCLDFTMERLGPLMYGQGQSMTIIPYNCILDESTRRDIEGLDAASVSVVLSTKNPAHRCHRPLRQTVVNESVPHHCRRLKTPTAPLKRHAPFEGRLNIRESANAQLAIRNNT
jgi:hypothetical protein